MNQAPSEPNTSNTSNTPESQSHSHALVIGVVTVSDRASGGVYEDRGGPAILDYLNTVVKPPWKSQLRVIPDEQSLVESTLIELCDECGCSLIVTTGGTGPARRDVTPEATLAVGHKPMEGFGEQMRRISLRAVPTAILSRQTAVIRYAPESGGALIVNLPGQPKAIGECLDAVFPAIPYCIDLIHGDGIERMHTNAHRFQAFRPGRPKA